MTDTTRICAEQDCPKPSNRPDQPLCYDGYQKLRAKAISLCSGCEVTYKPVGYPICRNCRIQQGESILNSTAESGKSWETALQEATIHPPQVTQDSVRAVETVRRNIKRHLDICTNHETNTIQYLVLPLLEGLGWDPKKPDQVILEYAPTGKKWHGSYTKVDVALFCDSDPVVFIEVKRLDREFRDEYMTQLEGYASNMNSGFAVLTNGQFWLVSSVTGGVLKHIETVNIQEGSVNRAAKSLSDLLGKTAIGRPAKLPTGKQIIDALKSYRRREAQRRRRPPYTIFNDAIIALISERKPANTAELQSIKGVGPTTIKQHGTAILKIVAGQ